jgi:hypothetical protein
MPPQKLLGERFRAFELCGRLLRPETLQTGPHEFIDDAGNEGRFRSDDRKVDTLGVCERDQAWYVFGRDVDVTHLGFGGGASVARGNENFGHSR